MLRQWGKIKAYIDLAMESVETDLDSGSVVWFAANVLGLNGVAGLKMEDVNTFTLPGDYWGTAWSRDTSQQQSYVTIYPSQVVKLVNEKFNPYEQNVTTAMLDAMSILKNGDIASSTGNLKDTRHNAIMAVQRGEAYYDEEGNLVYGTPPVKPKQDEDGNYYIEDEDGNIVFTDADGNPLEGGPLLPPADEFGQPVNLPGTPVDNVPPVSTDPGTATDPGDGDDPGTTVDPGTAPDPDTTPAPGGDDAPETGVPQLPPEDSTQMPDGI